LDDVRIFLLEFDLLYEAAETDFSTLRIVMQY